MLNFFSRHRFLIVVMGLFFIFTIAVAISFFVPVYGQYCGKNEYTNAKECATYHIALTFFWQIIKATNDYGSALTALATIAVACFTGTLWWVAAGQYDLIADQIDLARKEFIATHRPRIVLHSLKISHRSDESESAPIEFRYVNSGDSVGYVKEVGTKLVYQQEDMLQSDLDFHVRIISPPMKIESGEFGFSLTSDKSIPDLILSTDVSITDYIKFFCAAYIVYTDDLGTVRQIGFCRQYDPATDRWMKVKDSEYEYSY
jgi:hypothetical protein